MAPPANTTFATAVTISTFPFSTTQNDINDAGTNFTVYYRFIAPAGARVIGAWGFSGNIGVGYQPTLKPYNGPAGAPTQILSIAGLNVRIQFPVIPGNEYFLEFNKNINTAGPEHLDVNVQVHTGSIPTTGDIVVNDDTHGFPCALLSGTADNVINAFFKDIASGEAGDITQNAVMCFEDSVNSAIKVYSRSFAQLANIDTTAFGTPFIRCCRSKNKFYVGFINGAATVIVKTISNTGVVGGTTYSLTGSTTIEGIAADNTESILYYSNIGNNQPIKRWDLINNVALSDLVAPGLAAYRIVDMFVLQDGTILALFWNSAAKDTIVRRYDTTGAQLNSFAIGAQTSATKPRAAYALDDPISFWVWNHSAGISTMRNVRISDGAILTTRLHREFEGGTYQGAQTAAPDAVYGMSFSCPLMIMTGDLSGLYTIVRNKKHDSYYGSIENKIPDPTARTAIVGE